jgi:hypothetical protein
MGFEKLLLLVACTLICLIALERAWYEYISPLRRRIILRKSAHTEKLAFALNEGETIVGVMVEKYDLCFYVGRDTSNNTGYE